MVDIAALNASDQSVDHKRRLKEVTQELEISFLVEFLKHTDKTGNATAFSGGVGEQQFGSFLREERARLVVEAGGIGLAERLFNSLNSSHEII